MFFLWHTSRHQPIVALVVLVVVVVVVVVVAVVVVPVKINKLTISKTQYGTHQTHEKFLRHIITKGKWVVHELKSYQARRDTRRTVGMLRRTTVAWRRTLYKDMSMEDPGFPLSCFKKF